MAGESFAGRYLPVMADYVVTQNVLAVEQGRPTINLKSVLIGNGITDPLHQNPAYIPIVCTNATGAGPLLGEETCEKMRIALPKCTELNQK